MTTRINLPDGSVVNVPEGVPLEQAQAEIERYLAQAQQRSARPSSPVTQDPAVRLMAEREGLSPSNYIQGIDPRAAEAHRRRIERDRMVAMEPMGDGASFPSQQDLDRRARSDARNEATGASGIPERLPAYGADSFMDAATPATDANVSGRNPRGGLQYTDQRDSAPRSREQQAQAYPGGISDERQRQAMSIAQALPEYGSGRAPQPTPEPPAQDPSINVRNVRRDGSAFQQDWDNYRRTGDIVSGIEGIKTGLMQGEFGYSARPATQFFGSWADYFTKTPEQGAKANTEREKVSAAHDWYGSPEAEALFKLAPSLLNEAAKDPVAFFEQRADPEKAKTQSDLPVQEGIRPATEADKTVYQAATAQTPQMPRALSVQGAREQQLGAASQAPLSQGQPVASKPGKASPQALRNGTKTGMDYILEQGEQYVLQRLKRGDIAGATEFRNFMRDEQNQRGLENYNRAVVSTTLKDTEAFAKSTAGMVRYLDPDGDWEVDAKGTQLLFSDDGQVTGAEVALKNKRTGETLVNEYQGMKEVLDGLGDFASPTAGIERQRQRVEQAQAQKVENAKNFTSAYDAAVEILFPDGFVDGRSMQPFTPEQRQQADTAIREYIATSRPDLPQPPPRPAPAAPPPAASGVGANIRSFFGGSTGDKPVPTFGG